MNGEAFDLRHGKVLVLKADGRVEHLRMFPSLSDARDPDVIAVQVEKTRAIFSHPLSEEKLRAQLDLAHQQLATLRKLYAPQHPIIREYQDLIDTLGAKISQKASENSRGDTTERRSRFDGNAATRPPELAFIAWQPREPRSKDQPVYHADGSPAHSPEEKALLDQVRAVTHHDGKAKSDAHFVHFWFSHPFFEPDSLVDLKLTNESGHSTLNEVATSRFQVHDDIGWVMATRGPCQIGVKPKTIDLKLRYVIGPLKEVHECEVRAGNTTMMGLHGGSELGAYGQTHDGRAFVSISVNRAAMAQQRFGVEAALKDGRKLIYL